jgi:uncharacterized membrane protein
MSVLTGIVDNMISVTGITFIQMAAKINGPACNQGIYHPVLLGRYVAFVFYTVFFVIILEYIIYPHPILY